MNYQRLSHYLFLILISTMGHFSIYSKIRLMTLHYNRPDFLEIQCKCLSKFLKEKNDYELIVFNDATDLILQQQIIDVCKKYNAQCVIFPQHLHHTGPLIERMQKRGAPGFWDGNQGSVRHCQIIQYALDNYGYDHDDIVGIFEGDVFLIKDFSIRESLKNYDMAGAMQTDYEGLGFEYLWIGLCFFNIKDLPHKKTLSFDVTYFDETSTTSLDSGGSTYFYLKNNPEVKVRKYYKEAIANLPCGNAQELSLMGFNHKEIVFLQSMTGYKAEHSFVSSEFHLDRHFLHYSWSRYNWGKDVKYIAFQEFLGSILQ